MFPNLYKPTSVLWNGTTTWVLLEGDRAPGPPDAPLTGEDESGPAEPCGEKTDTPYDLATAILPERERPDAVPGALLRVTLDGEQAVELLRVAPAGGGLFLRLCPGDTHRCAGFRRCRGSKRSADQGWQIPRDPALS